MSADYGTVSLKAGGDVAIIFVSRQASEVAGDGATILLNEQLINRITSAQVVMNNRPAPGVVVGLGPVTDKGRQITLQASAEADIGENYQLRLVAGTQVIDVPSNVMRLAVEAAPLRLGPRVSPGPQLAESMEHRRSRYDANSFNSYEFASIVSQTFANATFTANACGGSYTYRKTIIDIPNLMHNEESLDRLDYELTGGEEERSEWVVEIDLAPDIHYRRSHIRACVDNWQVASWVGQIDGGRFEITVGFGPGKRAITGRAIDRGRVLGIWQDMWDWNDANADKALPDYRMSDLQLLVTLMPQTAAGGITYTDVDVRWGYGDWGFTTGHFRLSQLENKMVNYKSATMETIRQRIDNLFDHPDVRNRLSQAMTDYVTSNPLVNRVIGLTDSGTSLGVEYE